MRRLLPFVSALALGMVLLPLAAHSADTGLKIGFVDPEQIVMTSAAGKAALAALQSLKDSRQKDLDAVQSEIVRLQSEFDRQETTLSEQSKEAKNEELRLKKRDFNRMVEDAERELAKEERSRLKEIESQVMALIEQIGRDEGYSLILSKTASSLLYGDPTLDLTDRVVRLFDQKWRETH